MYSGSTVRVISANIWADRSFQPTQDPNKDNTGKAKASARTANSKGVKRQGVMVRL
jgi:hypothetical protein